jgi:iron complex transport system substrate-binding protein
MPSSRTPRRIACLQPRATVILAADGERDRLAAAPRTARMWFLKFAAHPRTIVADSWAANAEQILASQPDLVIASVPYQEKAVIEILRSGSRFLGFAPKTLTDICADIAIIAATVGASGRGGG